jgi:hypothetical protein
MELAMDDHYPVCVEIFPYGSFHLAKLLLINTELKRYINPNGN